MEGRWVAVDRAGLVPDRVIGADPLKDVIGERKVVGVLPCHEKIGVEPDVAPRQTFINEIECDGVVVRVAEQRPDVQIVVEHSFR